MKKMKLNKENIQLLRPLCYLFKHMNPNKIAPLAHSNKLNMYIGLVYSR
jgi:hypothetical protein